MGAVGIQSRAPITGGEVVVTAQHLPGAVPSVLSAHSLGEKNANTYPALALLMLVD